MREAVSDVLVERAQAMDGVARMVTFSLVAHVALLAAFALMPAEWRSRTREPESTPMMISIGGVVGPQQGMTQASARNVQEVAPTQERQMFTTPPAANKPEMVLPDPVKKPEAKPVKPIEKPVEKSATRKPTTGAQKSEGIARSETGGAQVPFGAFSTGGGGTGGMQINVGNFCCPDYIVTMNQWIRKNWNQNQGAAGFVTVRFTIRRDGMLTQVEVSKSSGNPLLDLESRRAVLNTQRLPPLPAQYTPPTLSVDLIFEYKR
jgi:TonB family protein